MVDRKILMGISERKEREKEQRRQDIIDAAERVFFSKGYENATMADIARSAELSKGTLYLYFTNKNELCMAITIRGLDIFHNQLSELKLEKKSGIDKFYQISQIYIRFSTEFSNYYQGLLNFRMHHQNCPVGGDYYRQCSLELKDINQIIAEIIRDGINDGTIKEEVEPKTLAHLIWGDQSGILPSYDSQAKDFTGASSTPESLLNYHFQLLRKGIETCG